MTAEKEKLKEISGMVVRNTGNYESVRATVTISLEAGGDPDEARAKLVIELNETLKTLTEAFSKEKEAPAKSPVESGKEEDWRPTKNPKIFMTLRNKQLWFRNKETGDEWIAPPRK